MPYSPIYTPNVIVGFEDPETDIIFAEKISQPAEFTGGLADLKKQKSVFASTSKNILTMEHSFNYDGKSTGSPLIKIKCLDLDEDFMSNFLNFLIVPDQEDLVLQFSSAATGRETFHPSDVDRPKDGDEFRVWARTSLGITIGTAKVIRNIVYSPPVTPVWVMYGAGETRQEWAGPYLGYVTRLDLSYDSANVKEYVLTITPTFARADDPIADKYISSNTEFQAFTVVNVNHMSIDNVLSWVERVLETYFVQTLGVHNIILALPDLSKMVVPLYEKIYKGIENEWEIITKRHRHRPSNEHPVWLDIDREVWRVILGAMGFDVGEMPIFVVQGVFNDGDAKLMKEAYVRDGRAWRGPIFDSTDPAESEMYDVGGFALGGSVYGLGGSQNWRDLTGEQLDAFKRNRDRYKGFRNSEMAFVMGTELQDYIEKSAATFLGVSRKTKFSFYEDRPEYTGPKAVVEASFPRYLTIKIPVTDAEKDPITFLTNFFKRLQGIIPVYYFGVPYYSFENNKLIIDYWNSLEDRRFAPEPGDDPSVFRFDTTEESVLVVGDKKMVQNIVYAGLAGFEVALRELAATSVTTAGHPGYIDPDSPGGKKLAEAIESLRQYITSMQTFTPTTNDSNFRWWDTVKSTSYKDFFFRNFVRIPRLDRLLTSSYSLDEVGRRQQLFKELIQETVAEFRTGYKDPNIISIKQDISKYLLANIFKISKTAALKDLLE
jgi:hypothetical protein